MILPMQLTNDTEKIWDECQRLQEYQTPFSGYAWHNLYFTTIGKNIQPNILFLPERHIIAPFERNTHEMQFSGGIEISDYMDLVGPDREIDNAWEEILPYIQENSFRSLRLPNVQEHSRTYSYFIGKAGTTPGITLTREDTTPILTLPASFDAYLSTLNPKHAHEAERKMRKFEREHSDVAISDTHDDTALETAIRLMKMDPRKAEFFTDAYEMFFHQLTHAFGGMIRIHTVTVGNMPVAAVLGFSVGSEYFLYNSGFDQVNGKGAGFYLKVKSIEWAIKNGYSRYNFLQGNERYKYELGGIDSGIYTIFVQFVK